MRFKLRCQFTERYTSENADLFREVQSDVHKIEYIESAGNASVVNDIVIGWLNETFLTKVQTESQLVEGFPVICLLIIDAIYGGERVRWQDVDWRLSYKVSTELNYKVLEKIWNEVKMERFREFRTVNTSLRFERLFEAKLPERLEFLRRMRDWYTVRSGNHPFDALRRRCEIMERSRIYGHNVDFPFWIESPTVGALRQYREANARNKRSGSARQGKAEFERLKDFLGILDVQSM